VASCDDAVEALAELRPLRPQPPAPAQQQHSEGSDTDLPQSGRRPDYEPVYRYGSEPGPVRQPDDTGIVRHGPGLGTPREQRIARGAAVAVAAVLVLAVGGIGLVGWHLVGREARPTVTQTASASSGPSVAARPLEIEHASLWQASKDGDENSTSVGNTITGEEPAWRTFGYLQGPKLLIKPGTGIIYDLGTAHTVSYVTVRIGAPGATMELRAAGQDVTEVPALEVGKAPPGFRLVSTVEATTTKVVLRTKAPVRTRFLLVWFTALPHLGSSSGGGGPYRDSISLVKVYGTE
jgi:hypothetical protein